MEFDMKRNITILFFATLLLTSCGEPASPLTAGTPTNLGPAEIAATMMQVQLAAEATQQVVSVHMSATAQVVGVTSTSQAVETQIAVTQQARIDAESTAEQERRDIQATQARIDADATQAQARIDAESTAEQARLDVVSTQQAAGTATAFVITMAALPTSNSLTQIANEQNIILKNNEVELSNLAVDQQREKNTPEWVVPFLIAILAAVVGAIYVIRYSRVREVKNDDGDIELLIIDGDRAIRPALLAGPVLEMGDEFAMPLLTSSAEQAKVTERAQAISAIKSMPAQTTQQAAQTFNKYFGSNRNDMFDVIDGDELPPAGLLDGETLKSLNEDWKESEDE
jgi:hypothetical protein